MVSSRTAAASVTAPATHPTATAPTTTAPTTTALPAGLPAHWTVRPLRSADAAAIAGLLTAEEQAHPADVHVDTQDIAESIDSPRVDLDRGTIGVFDGTELISFGLVEVVTTAESAAGSWTAYLDGAVHPDHERRGLGRWMVENCVTRAGLLRDALDPSLPGELKIGLTRERPGVAALVMACGFEVWRWFTEMRVDLEGGADLPTAPDLSGYLVRTYRPEDEEAVRLVSNEAFADHWGSVAMDAATWRSRFADSVSFRPGHSLLAVTPDGEMAGFVLVTEYAAETVQHGFATAYLARIGTARAHRGRGVASLLVHRVLPLAAAAGYRRVDLDVDSASPTGAGRIYARVGFTPTRQHSVAGLHLPPHPG